MRSRPRARSSLERHYFSQIQNPKTPFVQTHVLPTLFRRAMAIYPFRNRITAVNPGPLVHLPLPYIRFDAFSSFK